MLTKAFFAGLLATAVLGATVPLRPGGALGCLTSPPTAKQVAAHKAMAVSEAKADVLSQPMSRSDIYINVYVHVVSDSTSASSWYLSRATVNNQIDILNQYFQGTGFQYTLQDIDWTVNSNWAHDGDEYGMKTALRRGDYSTLNLYYITDIGPNHTNTGHCTYPGSGDLANDGCVMSAWTTPGGDSNQFSTGKITVHEVGHWHNLIHTFEGGCNGGDYVDDTPAESYPSSGCPVGRDTCPSPGLDPIYNHMDYSDDNCRSQFTPGQIARMRSSWSYYRG